MFQVPLNAIRHLEHGTRHLKLKLKMKEYINNWGIVLMLCLTLGLAPFAPEPHIVGKVKWVMGGAVGMTPMDWFDLAFHGFPYLLLIRLFFLKVFKKE